MRRPPCKLLLGLMCFVILTGCNPTQPFYLRDYGDLSYYLDQQIETKYPDVQSVTLEETANAHVPLTVQDQEITDFVDLTLEDAISIALQNSKVIRGYGTPGLSAVGGQERYVNPGVDNLSNNPAGAGTIYDVAIRESEPGFLTQPGQSTTPSLLSTNTSLDSGQGVEAALAEFDAGFTSSIFRNKTDRPQNFVSTNPFNAQLFQDYSTNYVSELSKKTAEGTQLFLRNTIDYRRNNNPLAGPPAFGFQALPSWYTAALQLEARQPLLRGRGAFINRMPVIFARIGADQQLAAVETQLQNMLCNVEIRYWELYYTYRVFEAAKENRDNALEVYNIEKDKFEIGTGEKDQGGTRQTVAQAQQAYFQRRAEVEIAFTNLLENESELRWLLGWATTDGRFIRPIDEPVSTRVDFDWCQILNESLSLRPTLRQERWELKKRELAVAYAKNGLLPQLNGVGSYSWVGLGDNLFGRDTPQFPAPDSGAYGNLFGGNFQEYRFGFEFGLPIGFRRELANVRNAQLKVAREVARLEDMELDVARELAQSYRAIQLNFQLAETRYNTLTSAETQLNSFEDLKKAGRLTVDLVLQAQNQRAQAKRDYYQSLVEYNKSIALMHLRKGTIMDYNSVQFGEGPWPGKAYNDASENARRRGASRQVNYGWTRPGVVSTDGYDFAPNASYLPADEVIVDGELPFESIDEGYSLPAGELPGAGPGQNIQLNPTPTPAKPRGTPESVDPPAPTRPQVRTPVIPDLRSESHIKPASINPVATASFVNGSAPPTVVKMTLGDQAKIEAPLQSRAAIRQVGYEE